MPWWMPTFPSLPTFDFSLPTNVQRKFLSYLLRRALGRFVKPDQLDVLQIDSQIGSGHFQIRDLEINHDAINTLLSGLPVELQAGTIGSIRAQIPWSNPLGGSIGLSLASLHLTLCVAHPSDPASPAVDIADSVANLAEEFVNDEISTADEQDLRHSIHLEADSARAQSPKSVPGALDPFDQSESAVLSRQSSNDPVGVSLFATLFQRLLLRFEMDIADIQLTLVHRGRAAYTLSIPDLRFDRYSSSGDTSTNRNMRPATAVNDQRRSVSVSGFSVSCCNLETEIYSYHARPQQSRQPLATSQSDSGGDKPADLLMSQSLAALPTRSNMQQNMDSDVDSSVLFQSALSTLPEVAETEIGASEAPLSPAGSNLLIAPSNHEEATPLDSMFETVVSFGEDPLVIDACVSFPSAPATDSAPALNTLSSSPFLQPHERSRTFSISISSGIIVCAIKPWMISAIVELTDAFTLRSSQDRALHETTTEQDDLFSSHSIFREVDVSLDVKGLLFLFLPSSCPLDTTHTLYASPLATPRLSDSYVRFFIDMLRGGISVSAVNKASVTSNNSPRTMSSPPQANASIMVSDVSILIVHPAGEAGTSEQRLSPILITDLHIQSQYPAQHEQPLRFDGARHREKVNPPDLPNLIPTDWLSTINSHQVKVSHWQAKPMPRPHHIHRHSADITATPSTSPQKASSATGRRRLSVAETTPAILLRFDASLGDDSAHSRPSISITFAPLHFLLDLPTILDRTGNGTQPSKTLAYVADAVDRMNRALLSRSKKQDDDVRRRQESARRDRDRLENRLLNDLDLCMDYRDYDSRAPTRSKCVPSDEDDPRPKKGSDIRTTVRLSMVRFELRDSYDELHSSALMLDIRETALSISPETLEDTRNIRNRPPLPSRGNKDQLLSAKWERIVLAISPPNHNIVTAFLSLGPLQEDITSSPARNQNLPRLTLSSSRASRSGGAATVAAAELPSVYACITKLDLDSMQVWVDNVSQLAERAFSAPAHDESSLESKDPSLIGSRFFLKPQGIPLEGTPENRTHGEPPGGQTIISFEIPEIYIRFMLPRFESLEVQVVPFDVLAMGCDILLEIKSQGQKESSFTVSVADAIVHDRAAVSTLPFLCFTHTSNTVSRSRSLVQLQFTSSAVMGSSAKESRIDVTLSDFTYNFLPDIKWVTDLADFVKSPPGVFEGVPPSEQTVIAVHIRDGAARLFAPTHPGACVVHLGELDFSTVLASDNPSLNLKAAVPSLSIFLTDDFLSLVERQRDKDFQVYRGAKYWKKSYYTLVAEVLDATISVSNSTSQSPKLDVTIDGISCLLHLCADTASALGGFFGDFGSLFVSGLANSADSTQRADDAPRDVSVDHAEALMRSLDEKAFRAIPEIGPAPDMISDDLPVNMDYLDESYGAAAGLREIDDNDLDDFGDTYYPAVDEKDPSIISRTGGETVRMLDGSQIVIAENHFNLLPAITEEISLGRETIERVNLRNGELTLFLYEGYDLNSTRRTIEHEIKEMKKRLAKIRQLVSEGQQYEPTVDETSALLFNSVYVGLQEDAAEMEPDVLIAAIDEELGDDLDPETATQSSWQSLRPHQIKKPSVSSTSRVGRHPRLTRASGPSIEFKLQGLNVVHERCAPGEDLSSRVFITVRDVEVLDHVKTSTWRKFLTALRSDSRGNIRETGSNMVRIELQNIRPAFGHTSEEIRLRAKLLPLRLHVDQDALDFLKKFFTFKDANAPVTPEQAPTKEAYIQRAEVFPVGIKLDYKPRRVDYRALRDGRTIELMNFFHFDGAEMTLRHITVNGVTGWPRFFDMLNELWTPDVKATQLAEVISGVAPIRSVVNVGSGVADLVLLPIAQYRKDGRLIRGVQKGTKAFVKSTAMEAIKLGARLATGTQVILEQTENILGSQFNAADTIMVRDDSGLGSSLGLAGESVMEPVSRYANQPLSVKEGVETAYASMRRNLNAAAQTILAVPMEVFERSGNEGAVRAVVRAVPIAVLKPMIGASEAVSKTLLGLQNTMDPDTRLENDAKYKRRS